MSNQRFFAPDEDPLVIEKRMARNEVILVNLKSTLSTIETNLGLQAEYNVRLQDGLDRRKNPG